MSLPEDVLKSLLDEYGRLYGESARYYAAKTFPKWKSGVVQLSGQTSSRLLDLLPRYLSTEKRIEILEMIVERYTEPKKVCNYTYDYSEESNKVLNIVASFIDNSA